MNNINVYHSYILGMARVFAIAAGLLLFGVLASEGATYYVATNGPGGGFTNWATAASNIQDAIDTAGAGDTVWVSNGVYNIGGRTNYPAGGLLTNRVVIVSKAGIALRSVNGPAVTIIQGAKDPITTNGPAAVRCLYVYDTAVISGFTLTNGATLRTADSAEAIDRYGGGIYAQGWTDHQPTISNCVIAGNAAATTGGGVNAVSLVRLDNCTLSGNSSGSDGGGAAGGATTLKMYNCILTGNSSGGQGGGAYVCTMYNCLLTGNSAASGGGFRGGYMYNCTVVSNTAPTGGGVFFGPALYNCIIYFNSPANFSGTSGNLYFYNSCTTPSNATYFVTGNITNDPMFADTNTANYRLQAGSPCVNTGTNGSWTMNSVDLDGHSRIDRFSGMVDMGCYEYLHSGTMFTFR